eukprot:351706-Chlamydomonas_euryale.AAC.2
MTRPGSQRSSRGRWSLVSRQARGSSRQTLPRRGCRAGTEVTRSAGSAPEPTAECGEEAQMV